MLYLQRGVHDEGVIIVTPEGKEITLFVESVKGGSVKLGFKDAEGFQVWRSEIWERKKQELERNRQFFKNGSKQ